MFVVATWATYVPVVGPRMTATQQSFLPHGDPGHKPGKAVVWGTSNHLRDLRIRRYHRGAVTFHYYYVFTIATSRAMAPVPPHGAAEQLSLIHI